MSDQPPTFEPATIRGIRVYRPDERRCPDPDRPVRVEIAGVAYADLNADEARRVAEALIAAATVAPAPEPAPKVSCPDGFHWIGQSFARCDHCALPAWEHAGMAELPKDTPLFSGGATWVLRPWKPGEADAIRRKWEPDMTLAEVIAAGQRREAVSR